MAEQINTRPRRQPEIVRIPVEESERPRANIECTKTVIVYCPPYLMTKDEMAKLQDEVENIKINPKLNISQLTPGTHLV